MSNPIMSRLLLHLGRGHTALPGIISNLNILDQVTLNCSKNVVSNLFRVRGYCQTATLSSKTVMLGQPSPSSHPHLLKEGQVTSGLSKEEFSERRFKLMESIATQALKAGVELKSHLVVIPSSTKVYMSDKIPYPFRQNTEFLYLSGFQEPDSILVLHSLPGKDLPEHGSILFVPKKSSQTELWEGPRTGVEGAIDLLGVNNASNFENFEKFLESFSRDNRQFVLWYDYMHPPLVSAQEIMKDFISQQNIVLESPRLLIQELRLIKSDAEIKLMRQSAETGALALKEVIRSSHPFVNEAQLHAKMEYECRLRGAERLAYPPVVAGGPRANIIHYTANNQRVMGHQMVLMDAGCEFHGYASDITRSWPVKGKFTKPQRDLYQAVYEIQEELIAQCQNFPSLDELFHIMCQLIGTKLQELGLIPGNVNKIELSKLAYNYCPHHVGHYLGMDVHDTTLISRNIKIKPGMVITIEPGIYIHEDNKHVDEKYRGIAIRIEDDVLITEYGPEVLSAHCPKSINEIERLFGERGVKKTGQINDLNGSHFVFP